MSAKKSNEINITDLINIIKIRWLSLLIVGFLGAVLAFSYSKFFVVPQYAASAQLFVDTRRESSEGKDTYINSSHITAAKELASTYVYIIKTNTVLNAIINDLNLDMSSGALASKISASVINDTQILRINVIDDNKERALRIAQKLVEISPSLINAEIDAGKLVSIDKPTVSSAPVSPNVPKTTMIGLILGIVILYAIFVIQIFFDNKIKSVDDIQKAFGVPVLGVIPALENVSSK